MASLSRASLGGVLNQRGGIEHLAADVKRRGIALMNALTAEHCRLEESRAGAYWKMWGPYLSERQWGTVREDYSVVGSAWDYFTHD